MNTVLKWSFRSILILLALILLYLGYVTFKFNQSFTPMPRNFAVSTNVDLDEGQRLARITGCYGGCHAADASGQDFFGVYASNLTKIVHDYSDAQLEHAIRQGIRPDGTSLQMMPSAMYQHLSNDDLSHIIGFLRTLPQSDKPLKGDVAMMGMAPYLGYTFYGDLIMSALYSNTVTPPKSRPTASSQQGEYMTLIACTECHGQNLQGFGDMIPSLSMVKAYSLEEFKTLLSTGRALGDRDVGVMSIVAKSRFTHMTEAEMATVYEHIKSQDFL